MTLTSLFRTPSSNTTSHSSHRSTPSIGGHTSPLIDGIDLLLQRITSERFAELRNIQLSERPVTGGNARGNIETFMRRAVHGPTEEERQQEDEANRPEHVANDVQFLNQQSVVQSSLHNDFRNILERTLLQRMSTSQAQRRNSIQRQERNLVGGQNFRSRLEALFGGRSTEERSLPARARPVRPPVRRERNIPHPPQQAPPLPPHLPPQPAQQSAPEPQDGSTASFGITIDAGMELLAQSIADDLNRLESLHVVSGMLRGDFRSDLEAMVQTRISNEDIGVRTQDFIRSLPGRRPDVQTASRGTAAYPQSQAAINAGVTAELTNLTRQMEEMKRMLAMSMEIQMDTQRAVRQEVAAIFSSFAQGFLAPRAANSPLNQPTMLHPPISTPVSSGQCVICIERSVDTVLYQCGHMCTCNQCGLQLKMDGHNCPMCRAPIRDVIRAYQTQS